MKSKIHLVSGVFVLVMIFVHIIFGTYTIIKNPDMTEMRLLITYWKEYLLIFILLVASLASYRFTGKDIYV